jgi:hypothetical protein
MASDRAIMYLIVPYFNFNNYQNNIANIKTFLWNCKQYLQTEIILIEGICDQSTQLDNYSDEVFKHIKINIPDIIWVKENLINIAISKLPKDWKYAAWIDKDIEFNRNDWAIDAIRKLNNCDLIQPWEKCEYIDEYGNLGNEKYFDIRGFKSGTFSSMSLVKQSDNDITKFKHPGHAWCISRSFYEKISKLFDYCIVGGADGLLYSCITQNSQHEHYRFMGKIFWEYLDKFKDVQIDFVSGTIFHHFHGEIENRQYSERVRILIENNFNPDSDLYYNEDGVLRIKNKPKLQQDISGYFASRKEDG